MRRSVIVAIVLAGIWFGAGRRYFSIENPTLDLVAMSRSVGDVEDYPNLAKSIEAKSSFADTFNYWREPWRPDVDLAAYWRPLTMQTMWLEAQLFGLDHSYNWMRVSILFELAGMCLFALFVFRISKRYDVALLTTVVLCFPRAILNLTGLFPTTLHTPVTILIEKGWKDQPDLWANLLVLATLVLVTSRRWQWALLCASLAVCFKESGWLAFPFALIVAAWQGSLKQIPKWFFLEIAGVVAALLASRYSAGPAVFFAHTKMSKEGWPREYFHGVSSEASDALAYLGDAAIALGLYLSFSRYGPRAPSYKAGAIGVTLLIAILLGAWQQQLSFGESLGLLVAGQFREAIKLLLWLLLFFPLMRNVALRKTALFFVGLGLLAAAPHAATPQAGLHTLSLAILFQSVFVACMLVAAWEEYRVDLLNLKMFRSMKPPAWQAMWIARA